MSSSPPKPQTEIQKVLDTSETSESTSSIVSSTTSQLPLSNNNDQQSINQNDEQKNISQPSVIADQLPPQQQQLQQQTQLPLSNPPPQQQLPQQQPPNYGAMLFNNVTRSGTGTLVSPYHDSISNTPNMSRYNSAPPADLQEQFLTSVAAVIPSLEQRNVNGQQQQQQSINDRLNTKRPLSTIYPLELCINTGISINEPKLLLDLFAEFIKDPKTQHYIFESQFLSTSQQNDLQSKYDSYVNLDDDDYSNSGDSWATERSETASDYGYDNHQHTCHHQHEMIYQHDYSCEEHNVHDTDPQNTYGMSQKERELRTIYDLLVDHLTITGAYTPQLLSTHYTFPSTTSSSIELLPVPYNTSNYTSIPFQIHIYQYQEIIYLYIQQLNGDGFLFSPARTHITHFFTSDKIKEEISNGLLYSNADVSFLFNPPTTTEHDTNMSDNTSTSQQPRQQQPPQLMTQPALVERNNQRNQEQIQLLGHDLYQRLQVDDANNNNNNNNHNETKNNGNNENQSSTMNDEIRPAMSMNDEMHSTQQQQLQQQLQQQEQLQQAQSQQEQSQQAQLQQSVTFSSSELPTPPQPQYSPVIWATQSIFGTLYTQFDTMLKHRTYQIQVQNWRHEQTQLQKIAYEKNQQELKDKKLHEQHGDNNNNTNNNAVTSDMKNDDDGAIMFHGLKCYILAPDHSYLSQMTPTHITPPPMPLSGTALIQMLTQALNAFAISIYASSETTFLLQDKIPSCIPNEPYGTHKQQQPFLQRILTNFEYVSIELFFKRMCLITPNATYIPPNVTSSVGSMHPEPFQQQFASNYHYTNNSQNNNNQQLINSLQNKNQQLSQEMNDIISRYNYELEMSNQSNVQLSTTDKLLGLRPIHIHLPDKQTFQHTYLYYLLNLNPELLHYVLQIYIFAFYNNYFYRVRLGNNEKQELKDNDELVKSLKNDQNSILYMLEYATILCTNSTFDYPSNFEIRCQVTKIKTDFKQIQYLSDLLSKQSKESNTK